MTRVKVCGITRLDDAIAAAELGASAIGFVFWPRSPRAVEPEQARSIVRRLPPFVSPVGVFVNQSPAEVEEIAARAGLAWVQLHGDEAPEMAAGLRTPVLKAVSLPRDARSIESWPVDVPLLVDAADAERRGGTGRMADWRAAADLARVRRVVLAGGLHAGNVAEAVRSVRPWAVDVSSGVEARPGVKDHQRIAAFCAAVRSAEGASE